MDITEAFRQEDIAKTDFFDFVVAPNEMHDVHRTMKSVNVYLESYNNNEDEVAAERKEANNNHLALSNGSADGAHGHGPSAAGFGEPPFWDKEGAAPRWEPAMLEAIGCWGQAAPAKTDVENTDGAIYTLTVLNGGDGLAAWYRPPDPEDESKTPTTGQGSHQNSLDLDTFLDSIPASVSESPCEPAFRDVYPRPELTTVTATDAPLATVKTEFAFDDSGYADKEDAKLTRLVAEIGGGGFDNNNDWKISDNNEKPPGGMDSLLRNALQGKAFLTRYNGAPAAIKTEKAEELGHVLGSPPASAASEASYSQTSEADEAERSPMVTVAVDSNARVVMYDSSGALVDADPASHGMDDIFLSQLDAASYPEDYEKLKRIETEVAESVEQFCGHAGAGVVPYRLQQIGGLERMLDSTVTSASAAKPSAKKYAKRSPPAKHQGLQSPSSSARKERSLHYCNICSKGFKDKYSVNVHIRTHTGEKPFNCSLCGKSFRQKAHLAKHYHTHLAQATKGAADAKHGHPPAKHGHPTAPR